jgi:energy-coupling factor transporter ATP-binding protein EcfA2
MKIKLLKASKIYNTLNFDLVFNPDVNILYGINGCGKTTVLKLLNKIFNCDFQYFESINFREIMLKYSIEKETYNIKFVKSKIEKEKGAFQITSNHPIIQNTFDNFVKLKKKFKKKNLFDSKQYLRLTTGWKSIFKSIYISIQRGIEGMDLPYSKTNKYADQEFNEFIEENYIRQGHVPNENQILSLYQNFLEANYTANKFSGRTRLYKNKSVNSTESAILSFKSIIQMKLVEYSRYSKKLEEEYTKESYQKVTSMMKSEEILKRMRESKKSVMNILIEEINEQASNFKGKIEIPSIQDFQNLLDNLEKEQENIQNKKNISTDYVILFVQFLKI